MRARIGKLLTTMVLGNYLMFGSVSSNKSHFEIGIRDMTEIKQHYGNVLNKLITKKVFAPDFRQAFRPEKEDIKTLVHFEAL